MLRRELITIALIILFFLPNLVGQRAHHAANAAADSRKDTAIDKNEIIAGAYDLYKSNRVYRRGCSEFVSDVLKIPWRSADSIMGEDPESIGRWPDYKLDKLKPGDIVGWKKKKSLDGWGHVAVYIGQSDCMFIDVRRPGARPRKRTTGYGKQELFKSSRY